MHRHSDSLPFLGEGRISNRLRAVLLHVPYYTIEGNARLARDSGLSASTISRIVRGKVNPSFVAVDRIARAISRRLKRPLEPRELFTTDGTYPTGSTCLLMGCRGCYPPEAWHEGSDTLRPAWERHRPGKWSLYPSLTPENEHEKTGGERPPTSKSLPPQHFIFS